jgi:predicted hotdog family 3-hydroxylacyl-ACP dehydratase
MSARDRGTGEVFPSVAELIPHTGAMCLLDEILEHSRQRTLCRVDPRDSALLTDPDGRVPVWVGLEYMAQCVAVHGGLAARARGEAPRPGLFLGSRRVRFGSQELPPRPLEVEARHRRGSHGLVAFDCQVRDPASGPARVASGATLVEGRVSVYIVEHWEDLLEEPIDGA